MGQNSPKEDAIGSLYARGPLYCLRAEMFAGACLLSPDSIRRTVVIMIGLVMIGIGWYKKTGYDKKVFRYMEEPEED